MNARFWIWWNDDWIKITLFAGGPKITLFAGGPNEEGYSYESLTYTNNGSHVIREYDVEARDCDGPLYTNQVDCVSLDNLKSVEEDEHGPARPAWKRLSSAQRDIYAEMAGY